MGDVYDPQASTSDGEFDDKEDEDVKMGCRRTEFTSRERFWPLYCNGERQAREGGPGGKHGKQMGFSLSLSRYSSAWWLVTHVYWIHLDA